jgi:hypothetical protein
MNRKRRTLRSPNFQCSEVSPIPSGSPKNTWSKTSPRCQRRICTKRSWSNGGANCSVGWATFGSILCPGNHGLSELRANSAPLCPVISHSSDGSSSSTFPSP